MTREDGRTASKSHELAGRLHVAKSQHDGKIVRASAHLSSTFASSSSDRATNGVGALSTMTSSRKDASTGKDHGSSWESDWPQGRRGHASLEDAGHRPRP